MKKKIFGAILLTAAALATASAQAFVPAVSVDKTVALKHKKNLSDMSIVLMADYDVKLIDVTDRVQGTVKLHPGDELAVVRDPRVNYCCGDLSKSIESVTVRVENSDPAVAPVLVFSPDAGGPIVRSFIGNRKGTTTLTIEIACRDSSGRSVTQTKTVKVVVH